MAPILATATGFTPQILDDPALLELTVNLKALPLDDDCMEETLPKLVELLTPWAEAGVFEEQVDLHEWIHALNVIDGALHFILLNYSKSLLLVEPMQDPKRMRRRGYYASHVAPAPIASFHAAESLQDLQHLELETIRPQLHILLQFTICLLRNSTGKSLYQSVHYLIDLLAAAHDTTADLALSALLSLAMPPAPHKQQTPEQQVHTTLLNQLPLEHARIVALARGWGTRAMGLGLAACVTTDDSIHGRLPAAAGELNFSYYEAAAPQGVAASPEDANALAHIHLTKADMMRNDNGDMFVDDSSGDETGGSSNKRRKVENKSLKSTAELYFLALARAGGREKIQHDRLFSLLSDIRLARSFHSQQDRVAAVQRRLTAMITMLHAHPSQEVLAAFFQAQPELPVEVVDLLLPTVSSANVSATTSSASPLALDAVTGLVGVVSHHPPHADQSSSSIPFGVRMLAVEALAALVLRRDGLTGVLAGSGVRLSSVLVELGVGKGQYLGVLPTLIRYSLAALTSASVNTVSSETEKQQPASTSETIDIGLAFCEATMPQQLPRPVLVRQALEFIDNVLSLTSAVVATPTGTSSLVDCGLVPALLTTIAVHPDQVLTSLLTTTSQDDLSAAELGRLRALLGFVMSQAVQILEGALVTHSNALSAFHELHGVDVLMKRLSREITATRAFVEKEKKASSAAEPMDAVVVDADGDVAMQETTSTPSKTSHLRIHPSQRVLLFGILNCLTVVFHQESSSSTSPTVPTGGTQLRKPELTQALIVILDNVESYGGHLASLVATLLSDVMNNDPHVVHHVHSSGIATSFLNMLLGKKVIDAEGKECMEPIIPPVMELIMAIPSVISALSLTEDGAKAVKQINPFPALLRIFYHPKYAMPKSRCLLNEMTGIVGTGLDEIMRHVERLRAPILLAIAEAMNQVVAYAEELTRLEQQEPFDHPQQGAAGSLLIDQRTCLIQYVMNFAQLLEQILHNEDHCGPFVEAGGMDALLKIFPASMPSGLQFLVHLSGMSAPSVGTVHHSTLEESLSVALRGLFLRYDTLKLIRNVSEAATHCLDAFDETERQLTNSQDNVSAVDLFPLEPITNCKEPVASVERLMLLSNYLRQASHVQWITNIVATTVRAASQRSQDSGTGWSRTEREWKKELSSDSFCTLVTRLARFHRTCLHAVCRVRTELGFESRERERLTVRSRRLRYNLRIVCPEGAVVRDGIEIDSCANIGSMEMGEIVEAFDRCVNTSGILRYLTTRGWVSEMTRGHGREPISEVISLWDSGVDAAEIKIDDSVARNDRRIEAGVPDLRTVAVGVMARGQAGYTELCVALSRLVTQGMRSMQIRTLTFEDGTQGAHIQAISALLGGSIRNDLRLHDFRGIHELSMPTDGAKQEHVSAGVAMYLGCVLNHIHACLFEDKRERRSVNFPLLVDLVSSDSTESLVPSQYPLEPEVVNAIRVVLEHGLADFAARSQADTGDLDGGVPQQRVSRSVAASVPPLVALLRKLMSTPLSSSPAAAIMSRMKWQDASVLLSIPGERLVRLGLKADQDPTEHFVEPEKLAKDLQLSLAEIVKTTWLDPRIVYAPPFLLHPVTALVGDVLVCLEDASKKKPVASADTVGAASIRSGRLPLSDFIRRRENEIIGDGQEEAPAEAAAEEETEFEPGEDAITQLMEMGFTRDHALDALESTRSNRIELAMDYALSNPPPSVATIERRRLEREERARRRAQEPAPAQGGGVDEQETNANETSGDTVTDGTAEDAASNEPSGDAMEDSSESLPSLPEATSKDASVEDHETPRAKELLSSWLDSVPTMACKLLASGDRITQAVSAAEEGKTQANDGDAEGEALAVVLSSFLLDVCHRYPEKRSIIVSALIENIKSLLVADGQKRYTVPSDAEAGVASLCHATVLFTRALPKTRLLVLQFDLVSALLSCVNSALRSDEKPKCIPLWMTPALLLLDIMAQPLVAFPHSGDGGDEVSSDSEDGDLAVVRKEHKAQVSDLCRGADAILSILTGTGPSMSASDSDNEADKPEERKSSLVSAIPAYFPLLSSSSASTCLEICHQLIVVQPEGLSPGLAHGALLLLLRLLRSPKISAQCLRMGMAEALLKLPKEARFTGNTGLTTLILRRFLEDEATLLSAMETEIRSTIVKLGKKSSSSQTNPVTLSAFMEAVTPLLCREPGTFLKALALSVRVDSKKVDPTASTILLISGKERLERVESIATVLKHTAPENTILLKPDGRRSSDARQKKTVSSPKTKSKTPPKSSKRSSFSRRNKKDKVELSTNSSGPNDSPAQHVAGLLIHSIITLSSDDTSPQSSTEITSFLWVAEHLEILADLVLAVPGFASAVHNYRPNRGKDKAKKGVAVQFSHALVGSLGPPKTFISFILHSLLPRDRWTIRSDHQLWERKKEGSKEELDSVKERRAHAYRVVKVSQTAARVLAALVARPGEGRKRVIADLAFALSGGGLGHTCSHGFSVDQVPPESTSRELCALQAWGELCLGFAAPRSNGRNLDATTSLSIETLRIMLENGMVHALLYGLKRVNLLHPMASSTCTMLLHPLEVLTRSSVTVAVKEIVKKESNSEDDQSGLHKTSAEKSDDHPMIDNSGDLIMAGNQNEPGRSDYDILAHAEDDEMDAGDEDDEMADGDEDDGRSGDEDVESSTGTHDESSGTDVSDDSGMEEDEDMSEDSDSDDSEEVDDERDWNVDYNDGYAEAGGQYEYEEVEEEGTERVEQDVDEGWTRIESSGFGGMLLGSRAGGLPDGPGADADVNARGVIDAAEAMIGSLLREVDISREALADIEESLGIRIMSGSRTLRAPDRSGRGSSSIRVIRGSNGSNRQRDVIGTLPHIHQRSRPDVGYSAFGRGGQWGDANPMEYVFGGPSITSGSRNYDLVSARENDGDDDTFPSLTQLDLQLFPGGPASAANARTQHSLHPLLCGVDLPPVNSLVSDLLPHGLRAARRGQMATRRPGDWTSSTLSHGGYLVSTSNGNIIRSTRTHLGGTLLGGPGARNVSGPVGWTDDGLPVDATVQEFSSAFERALGEPRAEADLENMPALEDHTQGDTNAEATRASETDPEAAHADISGQDGGGASNSNEQSSEIVRDQEQESAHVDDDRVASSLAAGLRLSPGSDRSGSDEIQPQDPNDVPQADGSTNEEILANTRDSANEVTENEGTQQAGAMDTSGIAESGNQGTVTDEGGVASLMQESGMETDDAAILAEENHDHPSDEANSNGLVCPPDVDPEVFHSLPVEMQRDCVAQYNETQELAAEVEGSSLDPEVLAALPEDMRREVIEQDRRERMRQQNQEEAPADPSLAEEMDSASFIASLAPQLREEILLTADETFLSSLPPNIVAEAQILRERASVQHRRIFSDGVARSSGQGNVDNGTAGTEDRRTAQADRANTESGVSSRKKPRSGKFRVETDCSDIVYLPPSLYPPMSKADLKVLIRLLYLRSPIRQPRLLQKVFQNLCTNPGLRNVLCTSFVRLLHDDGAGAASAINEFGKSYDKSDDWCRSMDALFADSVPFPPSTLLGATPNFSEADAVNLSFPSSHSLEVGRFDTAMSVSASVPNDASGSRSNTTLPPVVGSRIIDVITQLCTNSPRFSLHTLVSPIQEDGEKETSITTFEKMIGLLGNPLYSSSASNLDQLLSLLECAVSPLSHLSKQQDDDSDVSQRDVEAAASAGKEWVTVPLIEVSQPRLQLLCSILRMETCRDSAFTKVNTIIRRLCRIESNRGFVLSELAAVAHGLGIDALRDLRSLKIRMDAAAAHHQQNLEQKPETGSSPGAIGIISGSITLSTSTGEVKLLRVLQTLQALCSELSDDTGSKKNEGSVLVTEELVHLLRQMEFDGLWDELTSCLSVVQVLEGVKAFEDQEEPPGEDVETNDDGSRDESGARAKKLRNSAAGLLTRFLPTVESFFVANASATRSTVVGESESPVPTREEIALDDLVGGQRVIEFVSKNKVLLNALVRSNPTLLDKGLRALVQVPRCRVFLDFDVKRHWFKTQVRRLRQQASRRHGSLRLHIRRNNVLLDAYHQLRLRNADEMRGRLHITFRNEEGVDAGGLSREFFAILAKEIFNPNYALFTSTEDGCTFQPNPNSSINPDHLSYFRFVGRIVGKAVADGFLLDAHFTRSLYKHMLGMKPTHHDMEAIDPDYYRNLKTILEYDLEDIGLDLTFSIDDHSFGRSQVIDLVPNGRKTAVTEETKEEYVRLVCQHRMTAAIQSQIKAYLDGFYELVSPELIAIFTPRELELLISGMPDIDVHDLKKNTDYVGWRSTDKQIEWFWNILFSLSRNEKAAFLQFVTGSSKVPLAGFSELQGMRGIQKFSIHKANGIKGALMSAHTCFNSLDLPVYNSEDEMREKLLYAINEGGGAFLFA